MSRIAEYQVSSVNQFKGNPLIEALPPVLGKEETLKKLAKHPDWDLEISKYDETTRIFTLDSLQSDFFQPLPQTLTLKDNIDRLIRQGYIGRNPLTNLNNRSLSLGNSITLIGVAGMGKTISIDRILSLYPQVIQHTNYEGQTLLLKQIVYLKLNCPYNASMKGLLYQMYSEIDRLVGSEYYERMVRNRATVENMIQSSYKIAKACCIGVIVLDEIQHLSTVNEKSKDTLLNFLVTLANTICVPLIYVGTPASYSVLNRDFRQARRSSGPMGDIAWDVYENNDIFKMLVQSIWRYQITNKFTNLTNEIIDTIYFESQGITDVLIKLHSLVQVYATKNGYDEITPSIISYVANTQLSVVKPILRALKSGNNKAIFEYKDVFMPIEYRSNLEIGEPHAISIAAVETIKEVHTSKKISVKREKRAQASNPEDIRIIALGNSDNQELTVYERLKAAGLIKVDLI